MAFFSMMGGMRDAGFTRQERTFILLMRLWVLCFLGAAILVAWMPNTLLAYLNDIGRTFANWDSPPIEGGTHFWIVLSIALLCTLAYVSAVAQSSLLRHIDYAKVVILAKAISAMGFAAMLHFDQREFYYVAGAVIDGLIALITWRVYARAARSRN
jgi:hypothetical protein